MGCRKLLLALLIFFVLVVPLASSPAVAQASGVTSCSVNADCYKSGAYFCTCNGAFNSDNPSSTPEKSYCTDGEDWYLNHYYCENKGSGKKCYLGSQTSSQKTQYTCDNGASVWNNAQENSCTDGKDDDYDGLTDCSDSECAINQVCATTTTSPPSCTQGSAIPTSGCVCGGYNYYSGYCCSNAYSYYSCDYTTSSSSTSSTTTTQPTTSSSSSTTTSGGTTTTYSTCGNGAINPNSNPGTGCICAGTTYFAGWCCNGAYQPGTPCGTTTTYGSTTTTHKTDADECPVPNGMGYYAGGVCTVKYCNSGYYDCDKNGVNGCESTKYCNGGTSTSTLPQTNTPCKLDAAVTSLCNCGGWSQNSGYCCAGSSYGSGYWQSYPCSGTSTTYYPPTTITYEQKCTKASPWFCYDDGTCSNVGANWCKSGGGTSYCSSYECPKCTSSTKYNCYSDTDCKTASGNWCLPQYGGTGWCTDTTCPTYKCSSKEYWYCYNEKDCTGAEANWCGTWCMSGPCPTCSKSQPWNCYTSEKCSEAGANWCTNQPPIIPYASTASGATGYAAAADYPVPQYGWCQEGKCPTYTCSYNEPWYCYEQKTCADAGAKWCVGYGGSGYCQNTFCPTYTCSSNEPWNCFKETDCTKVGAQWCSSSGTYSSGWCSTQCPTCSSAQKYNCFSKDKCSNADGNWCGTDSTGWCSDSPCAKCSSTQSWACYDKSSCETTAEANWCGNYCSSTPCPVCSKSQPWNCYVETDCKSSGGNWCGTWCQEGSYPCPTTKGSVIVEPKQPDNCKRDVDSTGYVHYVCDVKADEKCPSLPSEAKNMCEAYGGTFTTKKDERGCEFADCSFKEGFDPSKVFLKKMDRCLTDTEVKEYSEFCKKAGLEVKFNVEGGCKIPYCLKTEVHECEKEINPKILRGVEEKCKKEGLELVKDFDPRGCAVPRCAEPDFCKKVPSKAYIECENQGGELVVKTDERGCATFAECVKPGDNKVYLEGHEEIKEVPDEAELLSLALKLEKLKVQFEKMSDQAKALADYYQSTGSSEAKRFKRVSDMFLTANDKIDEIKTTLKDRLDTLSTKDVEEIKLEIRKIRKVILKDILFIMLSTKDDVKEIVEDKEVDCGTDSVCFDKNFRICKKVVMKSSFGEGTFARVLGENNGKCSMEAQAIGTDGKTLSMKCEIPDYSFAFKDPNTDVFPHCTGTLADFMKAGGEVK